VEALICIPTYNERENIERLINQLLDLPVDLEVCVIDDNSPDGTGEFMDEWSAREPRVHVLHRPGKMGLGGAYIKGFKWALQETDAKYVFMEQIADVDLVIGSRYVNGITVMNWPLSRLILSVGANIYTRVVTGLPLHDATGGFKCFRREVLEALPLDHITSDGYSFQIELNYHAWKRKFRIVEIPIVFVDRLVGTSKMSRRIVWEAAFLVWKLRLASLSGRIP
jgi:dolichol-phosphate mannosyltransferase